MNISKQKFPKLVIYAHWSTLCLVLLAYFSSKSPIQDYWLGQIHVSAGSMVFIFFFIRITLYFSFKTQFPDVANMPPLQKIAFKWMKILLYLCLFTVPCIGWIALSTTQSHFNVFGIDFPLLDIAETHNIGLLHQILANVFITLIGLHAFAALFHHFILKDNVLKSMK